MNTKNVLATVTVLTLLPVGQPSHAQTLEQQKAGVVKVTAKVEGQRRTGTGFIVRLDQDTAYILTASHVVEGDNQPGVEFFTRQNVAVPAETARIEGGDPRGLALLLVRGKSNLAQGIVALPLAERIRLSGGEEVTAIGFPRGGGPWAVVRASIVAREGRDLTIGGSLDEGNSGGPLLKDGEVVGVVTGVEGSFGRAAPVTIARLVLEGWGVQLPAATAEREPAPASPPSSRESAPAVPPSSGPRVAQGSIEILHARCEKLRAGTSFRVTLNGEAQGPAGAAVRTALASDEKVTATPKASCKEWKECRRDAGAPEKTRWSMSTIALLPAPTHAVASLVPGAQGEGQVPYAEARVELDCLAW
jgi:hypothetical protein